LQLAKWCLTGKHETWLKMAFRDKHSSLLCFSIYDGEKL
jgi:hypothetical protein